MVSGEALSTRVLNSWDMLKSQLRQNRHPGLHPLVRNVSTGVPGKDVIECLLLDGIDAETCCADAEGAPESRQGALCFDGEEELVQARQGAN